MLQPETEPPKHLLRAEVDAALVRLVQDPAQFARVLKLANYLCLGLPAMEGKDLLGKAMCLLMAGRRKWPRCMSAQGMLKGVMKSVASNARKKLDYVLADDLGMHSCTEDDGDSTPGDIADDSVSDPALLAEAESSLRNAVKGDEEVELLLEALAEGLSGPDVAKELGWTAKTSDAARKRLSRRLDALESDRSKT